MLLKTKFDNSKLIKIKNQAIIYQCACPAQIVDSILSCRELWHYQDNCENATVTDVNVHHRIKVSVEKAHAEYEACLEEVLIMEGWDMQDFIMPESLKKVYLTHLMMKRIGKPNH